MAVTVYVLIQKKKPILLRDLRRHVKPVAGANYIPEVLKMGV